MIRGLYISLAASLAALMLATGCEQKKAETAPPPPLAVTVSQPARQNINDFVEFTGNAVALETVDVRARVKGFLKKINFVEGSNVKQGDLLFEIEPDIFQAEVDAAKAKQQSAEARLARAKADLAIKQEMLAGNAASKLDVIQAEAAVATNTAEVALGKAEVEQKSIDLGYTKIYAPISGRINRSQVDAGNLVGADGNTLLATIVNAAPIYVYFDADENTVLRFSARLRAKGIDLTGTTDKGPVYLALGDSDEFAYQGIIDFVDNTLDPSTGTVKLRGRFDNKDRAIAPGFFGRVRIPDGDPYDAILVPERSIGVDQGQKYLLVVNDKNIVEVRRIETGTQHGTLRVVRTGLKPDEWVVTEGILRTRPGITVSPQQKPLAAARAPAPAAPATPATPATAPVTAGAVP